MPAEVTQDPKDQQTTTLDQPNGQVETTPASTTTPAPEKQEAPKGGETKSGENAAPKTPLEAAKRVMAKEQKQGSETKTQTDATGKPASEKPKDAPDDEENLPFKDHPAYRKVQSENRILKVAQKKNEEAIKALEPKAQTFDELSGYLQENNLGRDDFANGLTIMVAVRNDPAKALELLAPVVSRLQQVVGITLPADLQKRVDSGELTAEAAQAISRSQGEARLAEARRREAEERVARERQEREQGDGEKAINSVVDAINEAERAWTARDPDAPKLRQMVEDRLLAVGGAKPPRNAEEARQLFDACLADVKKAVSGWSHPKAKDGPLPSGGATTQTTTVVPQSSLDAARAALASAG